LLAAVEARRSGLGMAAPFDCVPLNNSGTPLRVLRSVLRKPYKVRSGLGMTAPFDCVPLNNSGTPLRVLRSVLCKPYKVRAERY
jgi:hypothetical protein